MRVRVEASSPTSSPIGLFVRLAALFVLSAALLAACSSSTPSTSPSGSPGSGTTKVGVKVSGAFGAAPQLSIPTRPAPASLTQQTLVQGNGAPVAKGDTLVANYVGETWQPKAGKPNVFDSSFKRGSPAAFVIGEGAVIAGWDKTLVGKKLGSRVLLTVPPADGYGSKGQPTAGIRPTDTLVFVVDLVTEFSPNASAPGTAVSALPRTGLPKITNVPGKQPQIISTAGVKAPSEPTVDAAGRRSRREDRHREDPRAATRPNRSRHR